MSKTMDMVREAYLAGQITPADLIAMHRRQFGNARMSATPAEGQQQPEQGAEPTKPEGVTDEEWNALADPGKRAIIRLRQQVVEAENKLAAKATVAPPVKPTPPKSPEKEQPDIAAIVQQAVQAAIEPFQRQQEQRDAADRAEKVVAQVRKAATGRLHDAGDALAHIDLTTVIDANGVADEAKIKAAIDDLVQRKPHLAKPVDDRRRFDPSTPLGGATPQASTADQVKEVLAKMQRSVGVKLAGEAK